MFMTKIKEQKPKKTEPVTSSVGFSVRVQQITVLFLCAGVDEQTVV